MEVHIAMTDYQFLETLMNNKKKNVEKTSNNKHDWTPEKYLNVLHHNRRQKQL